MKKQNLYATLLAVFCGTLLISNVLASKMFAIGTFTFPGGVIVFPIVYIINDVLAEVYGFRLARRAIMTGFGINLFAVFAYNIAIALPSPAMVDSGAFQAVLGSTWRVLLASFTAYLAGSLLNTYVMVRLKQHTSLFVRCVVSTLFGEGLDGIVFSFVAFLGIVPINVILVMILSQTAFKVLYELLIYPVTKTVIRKVQALE